MLIEGAVDREKREVDDEGSTGLDTNEKRVCG